MESFFGTLKTELVHHGEYPNRDAARRDLFARLLPPVFPSPRTGTEGLLAAPLTINELTIFLLLVLAADSGPTPTRRAMILTRKSRTRTHSSVL